MKAIASAALATIALTGCSDQLDPLRAGARASYSATTASWISSPSMADVRFRAAAATGLDGRIYVFGGSSVSVNGASDGFSRATSGPAGAEVFNPATNSWSAIANPGAFFNGAVVRGGDGRLYMIGGMDAAGTITANVRVYTPATNSYANVAPMGTARYGAVASTGLDGKVYVVGGEVSNMSGSNSTGEVYSPATNTWTPIAPADFTQDFAAAATGVDGRIYVIAGTSFFPTGIIQAYDPISNTWAFVNGIPAYRFGIAAVASPDGNIYVFGGAGLSSSMIGVQDTYAYDPVANTVTTIAPLNSPRAFVAGAIGNDGRIYALGGWDGSNVLRSVETLQTTVPIPTIQILRGMVEDLEASGTTKHLLTIHLDQAIKSLAKGNQKQTIGFLNQFIDEVERLVRRGQVGAADGDALIAYASQVLNSI